MTTLIEKSILNERLEKSRSGIYADTSENRRKHRVGQKYGSEKKEEEKPEKTSSNEKDPAKELEAVDKVIAAINEGKLKLPQEEIMVLIEKKNNLELAKRQAEKIHSGVKANEEKRNAAEAKETSKKINEAQKKERIQSLDSELEQLEEKREKALRDRFYISSKDEEGEELNRKEINDLSDKIDKLRKEKAKLESKKKKEESSSKKSAEMDSGEKTDSPKEKEKKADEKNSKKAGEVKETSKKINEAQKEAHKQEASGKAPEGVTQASYDSITKNAKATQRGYTLNIDGKDVRVERTIDTSGGQRTPVYQIQGMDKKYWDLGKMIEAYRKDNKASETDKEDLREARKKLAYLQDNEERLIKRDGKERYEERLKQAKDEVAELKGEKPKEEKKPEAKSGEKEELDEDGELVTITNDKEKFERYRIFRDLHAARMKRGTSPTLSKMGYLKNSGDVNQKGNEKYYELQKEFGDKKYAFKEETQEQKGEKKTDKASDPIYQVQQKKKEASKKYDSKREEARKKYDKEADEIRSEIDKLYESDHPDAAKKRKELWNTLKEKTNKYDAETSRLKDEYEAEYKKLDEAEDKLYDQRQKEETSEEVKESYTRIKFEDVPNSGKINLKKYLSEKVRKGVDEKWSNIKNIPTENLKKMEKGLVNDLNKNFEAIKKSQRAELLYSIMKVKGELEKRGKESQKKE